MNKIFSFLLFYILFQINFSCSPTKPKSSSKGSQDQETNQSLRDSGVVVMNEIPVIDQVNIENDSLTYSLVVSFFSKGEGIDLNAMEQFETFLNQTKKKEGSRFSFEGYPWGREGEIDFCIRLENLTAEDKEIFIREAEKITASSKLVHLRRNAECRFKKQR